jgi:hypothetical protein
MAASEHNAFKSAPQYPLEESMIHSLSVPSKGGCQDATEIRKFHSKQSINQYEYPK